MYFRISLVFLIISTLFQRYVNPNNDGKLKSATIEAIVEKLCNITLNSLSNKSSEEKFIVLTSIEDKLKRSAIGAGTEGRKYVRFIMHGIKAIVFNISNHVDTKIASAENMNYFRKDDSTTESLVDEMNAKERAIKNIALKIETLAKKYLKYAESPESKQVVIDTIKKKVMDAANRRHMKIHSKHKEIKSYGNIIAKGIDLIIRKNVEKATRRIGSKDDDVNINNKGIRLKIMHAAVTPTVNSNLRNKPTIAECEELVDQICSSTKTLNTINCRYDKNVLPLGKLCNDIPDCLDKTDERDCAEQAKNIIQNASRIMSLVEPAISPKCLSLNMNKEILLEQTQVLRAVLQSQLRFIEKYANPPISQLISPKRSEINKNIIKKTVNEVALVVSSLANALDGSLCARRFGLDGIEEVARRYSGDIDPDEAFDQISDLVPETMKSCVCNGLSCANSTCNDLCKRICWQEFNLDRWFCGSVDGSPSVPVDLICDGKLDCYDETDEIGCSLGGYTKFEAGNMYNNILKQISVKTRTREYYFVLPDLLMLYDGVKLMQKLSIQRDVDVLNIKFAREQCFSRINFIYNAFLNQNDVEKLNNGYAFLSNLSENLINAMKLSRTGNDRIISSDRCLCTESRCVMHKCSNMCNRACSVQPRLTMFHCGNAKINNDVPINVLCNGKSNCPNGEDEENCSKEVCRPHHLIVLRHKLKDIGLQQKGTALGEVLVAWKTKVTATIQIAEKADRPTPKVLKDIISHILQDLVMSYASLEYSRRNNNNNTIKEFVKISQLVIDSIKSCGQ